jgi:uncharacterized protein YndB with AHSA1/START domain
MIDFTTETTIRRDPADVFAYVADPSKLSTWQVNTVQAEQEVVGALGLGTRLHEVHRAAGGKEMPSVVEVARFEPPRRLDLRVVEGTPVHADIGFESVEGGTLMRFRVYGRLSGLMRLAEPLLGRTLRRQFRADCDRLKEVLEREAVVTS